MNKNDFEMTSIVLGRHHFRGRLLYTCQIMRHLRNKWTTGKYARALLYVYYAPALQEQLVLSIIVTEQGSSRVHGIQRDKGMDLGRGMLDNIIYHFSTYLPKSITYINNFAP